MKATLEFDLPEVHPGLRPDGYPDSCIHRRLGVNNTSRTLKPCPWCATTWTALHIINYGNLLSRVVCDNCEAEGPPENGKQDAIDAWNDRITEK